VLLLRMLLRCGRVLLWRMLLRFGCFSAALRNLYGHCTFLSAGKIEHKVYPPGGFGVLKPQKKMFHRFKKNEFAIGLRALSQGLSCISCLSYTWDVTNFIGIESECICTQ